MKVSSSEACLRPWRSPFPIPARMKNRPGCLCLLALAFLCAGVGQQAHAAVGASLSFVCMWRRRSGALAGGATVQTLTVPPPNSSSSAPLEASGHAYVQLNATGQSVTLTNNTAHVVTALNVRYSITDAPTGGGITNTLDLYVDGVFRQAITLNSSQTWCYQTSGSQHGWSQDRRPVRRTFFSTKRTSSSPARPSLPAARSPSCRMPRTPRPFTGWTWWTWIIHRGR